MNPLAAGSQQVQNTCLQLLRHAAADGLCRSIVGAVEDIPILAMPADAIGRASPLCMRLGQPFRVRTAAAEIPVTHSNPNVCSIGMFWLQPEGSA